MFNNRQVVAQVFPQLRKSFKFTFNIEDGSYKFRPATEPGKVGVLERVNATTGMVEHPASINWSHFRVKTFFGLPRIFSPGDWMKISSPVFIPRDKNPTGLEASKDSLVVEGAYRFNDENAICEYIVSPSGSPVNGNAILAL